jgi:hypothetical protein
MIFVTLWLPPPTLRRDGLPTAHAPWISEIHQARKSCSFGRRVARPSSLAPATSDRWRLNRTAGMTIRSTSRLLYLPLH